MSDFANEKLKIQCPAHHILDLIHKKKWKQVKRSIFFNKSIAAKCTGPCKSNCKANHSILHYACQFRPPLDVVKALFKAYPNAIFEKDCKERYALHIACKHGCRPEIIKYLLEKNPEAASKADKKGRTPLLLAFKSFVFQSRLEWDTANNELVEIGEMIAETAPFMITKEDKNGMTALEYGIEEEYRSASIEILQITVAHYQRALEKETHENIYSKCLAKDNYSSVPQKSITPKPTMEKNFSATAA